MSRQGFWTRLVSAVKGENKVETKVEETAVTQDSVDHVLELVSPIAGNLISLSDIKDPVFSQGMMGTGFGIEPTEGKVVSPVDGKVISVFPTKHAVTLQAHDGTEMLIHFGLDTTLLKGEGFTCFVEDGQDVKAGDLLLEVDIEAIRDKVPSLGTPVVFPSLTEGQQVIIEKQGLIGLGEKGRIKIK